MKSTYQRRERERKARSAGELVAKVLDGHNLTDTVRIICLHLEWRRLVGPRLAARTRPSGLRQGMLYIQVWDASWLHHLSFMQRDLIDTINERMGDPPMVSELRMKVGWVHSKFLVKPPDSSVRRQPRLPALRSIPEPASDERAAEIAAHATCVDDPELRQMIIDLRCRWDV